MKGTHVGLQDSDKTSQIQQPVGRQLHEWAFTLLFRIFQSVTFHSLVNAHCLFISVKSHCKFLEQQQPQFIREIKDEHKRKHTRKMMCIEHNLTSAKALAALCSGHSEGLLNVCSFQFFPIKCTMHFNLT